MLPMPIRSSLSPPSSGLGVSVSEYIWRVFNLQQMDFQFAYSQMVDLLRSPAEVYKTTSIRKQIKNQWSRDDPAFLFLLCCLLFCGLSAFLIGFGSASFTQGVTIVLGGIFILFLGVGAAIASGLRWYANTSMRVVRLHSTEQQVEWLYAFDIHCNSFFPLFVALFPIQYLLTPYILTHSFLATLTANTLYLAAVFLYFYITFLGYAALPFIEKPERLLYPLSAVIILYVLTLLLNINLAYYTLHLYFGHQPVHDASPSFFNPVPGNSSDALIGEIPE